MRRSRFKERRTRAQALQHRTEDVGPYLCWLILMIIVLGTIYCYMVEWGL